MSTVMTAHKSRWGYHPCDYAEFQKLKEAHLLLLTALRQLKAWERWDRKEPQNRVQYKTVRDESGRKVGRQANGPMPEPSAPMFLHARLLGWEELYQSTLEAYRNARRPVPTPEDVSKLQLPSDFWKTIEALKRWNVGT